jgi:D-amino peptidase
MKVYMHWDMEGCSGLFHKDQAWYWYPGVPEATKEEGLRLLMADVDNAVAAALDAGADEVIVCDTHHGGGNLVVDQIPADPRITYHGLGVGYQDGARRWMPGLDERVDCFLLPAHHAKEGTPGAFLPHTAWSRELADFRINGRSVGEIGLESCFAGHWDVPFALVHGDAAVCAEAREQFPGTVTGRSSAPSAATSAWGWTQRRRVG